MKAYVGMELGPLRLAPLDRVTLVRFAGASGNLQAVHIDSDAARAKGRGDVFAHGMLSMAWLERLLTEWVPQRRVRSLKARFIARVPLGDAPVCTGRIVALSGTLATVGLEMKAHGEVVVRAEAVVDIAADGGGEMST